MNPNLPPSPSSSFDSGIPWRERSAERPGEAAARRAREVEEVSRLKKFIDNRSQKEASEVKEGLSNARDQLKNDGYEAAMKEHRESLFGGLEGLKPKNVEATSSRPAETPVSPIPPAPNEFSFAEMQRAFDSSQPLPPRGRVEAPVPPQYAVPNNQPVPNERPQPPIGNPGFATPLGNSDPFSSGPTPRQAETPATPQSPLSRPEVPKREIPVLRPDMPLGERFTALFGEGDTGKIGSAEWKEVETWESTPAEIQSEQRKMFLQELSGEPLYKAIAWWDTKGNPQTRASRMANIDRYVNTNL